MPKLDRKPAAISKYSIIKLIHVWNNIILAYFMTSRLCYLDSNSHYDNRNLNTEVIKAKRSRQEPDRKHRDESSYICYYIRLIN